MLFKSACSSGAWLYIQLINISFSIFTGHTIYDLKTDFLNILAIIELYAARTFRVQNFQCFILKFLFDIWWHFWESDVTACYKHNNIFPRNIRNLVIQDGCHCCTTRGFGLQSNIKESWHARQYFLIGHQNNIFYILSTAPIG